MEDILVNLVVLVLLVLVVANFQIASMLFGAIVVLALLGFFIVGLWTMTYDFLIEIGLIK